MIPRWELIPVSERMGYRLDLPHPGLLIKILELPPFVKSNAHTGFVGLGSAVVVRIWGQSCFRHRHVVHVAPRFRHVLDSERQR